MSDSQDQCQDNVKIMSEECQKMSEECQIMPDNQDQCQILSAKLPFTQRIASLSINVCHILGLAPWGFM